LTDALSLETPPVAVSFVAEPPPGIPSFQGEVPSACTFWRRAEQGTFYADAPSHFNCLVGSYTMGLSLPPEKGEELMGLIGVMQGNEYFSSGEVPHVPVVAGEKSGIVYGPLAEARDVPDVVLMWLAPYQAMLLQEATGGAEWAEQSGIPTYGRPSCAAIPAAIAQARSTQSLGCMGMRVFTEVGRNQLLGVLPKEVLKDLPAAVDKVASSNDKMAQHYRGQKALHTKDAKGAPVAS
jgi:uncharacterized protein (DUF169 family)